MFNILSLSCFKFKLILIYFFFYSFSGSKCAEIVFSKMTISNIEMHNRISRQLENSHSIIISPTNEWFKQCVDFFMSDNPNVII